MDLVIVGNPGDEHIGAHLMEGARKLNLRARLVDTRTAAAGPAWKRRLYWHFLGHRPPALAKFNRNLLEVCREVHPRLVLITGIAPVTAESLDRLKEWGIVTANYQTDDPWNPRNGASHFWGTLPRFDWIFSPRKAAIPDLRALGCRQVEYLPFAYNPRLHFVEPPPNEELAAHYRCDVGIIGGADRDRYPLAEAVLDAGLSLTLYGGYWERNKRLRPCAKGFVQGSELRWAAHAASVHLCMGRKANRDGHAMRSYELPAMGAVLVAEDTEDHRALFGPDGEAVLYYKSVHEMVDRARMLVKDPQLGQEMAQRARAKVTQGFNTYADRLQAILIASQTASCKKKSSVTGR